MNSNSKFKSIFTIVLVLLMMSFIVGCKNEKQNSIEHNLSSASQITIKHHSGITIVPKNPKRIVVLDFGALDIIDSLNVNNFDILAISKDIIPSNLSDYDSISVHNIGGLKSPNLEHIYTLKPDLIIMSGRQEVYYDKLSEIAPTIDLSDDKNLTWEQNLENRVHIIASIFNKEDKADQYLQKVMSSVLELRNRCKDSKIKGLTIMTLGNKMSAYGKNSRYGLLYDSTGLDLDSVLELSDEDLKSDKINFRGKIISFEYIKEANPDYILVIDRSAAIHQKDVKAKDLFDNDLIKSTNAYKNNKIIYLSSDLWYLCNGGLHSIMMQLEEVDKITPEPINQKVSRLYNPILDDNL